jgi:hypothetical protein
MLEDQQKKTIQSLVAERSQVLQKVCSLFRNTLHLRAKIHRY